MKGYHRNSLRTNVVRFDRDSRSFIARIASLSDRLVDLPVNLGEGRRRLSTLFQQIFSPEHSENHVCPEEAMRRRVHALIHSYLGERCS